MSSEIRASIGLRLYGYRLDWMGFRRWGWAERLAQRLPDKLVLACFVRVMSHAWSDAKHAGPDDITYSDAYKAWERRNVQPPAPTAGATGGECE